MDYYLRRLFSLNICEFFQKDNRLFMNDFENARIHFFLGINIREICCVHHILDLYLHHETTIS